MKNSFQEHIATVSERKIAFLVAKTIRTLFEKDQNLELSNAELATLVVSIPESEELTRVELVTFGLVLTDIMEESTGVIREEVK